MTSHMEMSLDDIIQKKKKENFRYKGKIKKQPPQQQIPVQKHKIVDARNKIISRKRTQITDAREKLAELARQKDARLKLQQLREKRLAMTKVKDRKSFQGRDLFLKTRNERVFIDPSRQVTSQPLKGAKYMRRQTQNSNNRRFVNNTFGSHSIVNKAALKPILRTVENDIEIIDEEMPLSKQKTNLHFKIIAHNYDHNRSTSIQRTAIVEKESSPPRPPSILKKRPMAALRTEKKDDRTEKPILEYRIIVSNLRNTVTGGDIEELFGDVGGMLESRLVRPGTAEVIYNSLEDAQKAVDLYHNRQLDGQPMNCLLVTPRSGTSATSRTSTKPALYSTNSNVEPDLLTFHKVMFSNFT
ncbi:PREDICTED: polymerase delta-interacting protein 3-like [Papilio xuthus]|uniref:Polymerase delta-interacting protein 3-like n=1 Tax=Papilio xuthus TaxID=66420 RepID=A0AAJ6ZYU8_PAPXU|nr:PREDICTED: polymerase delta-interacting protein 3-like [Papilio xuthus]XP_013182209.1 PREDICTED: polymerase delta-interacting protein 3-like [Papilio xuthus]XP_013182210.1 PREDICTED: polymerase delta-interacting protein 3-like [Papilio xuthus]